MFHSSRVTLNHITDSFIRCSPLKSDHLQPSPCGLLLPFSWCLLLLFMDIPRASSIVSVLRIRLMSPVVLSRISASLLTAVTATFYKQPSVTHTKTHEIWNNYEMSRKLLKLTPPPIECVTSLVYWLIDNYTTSAWSETSETNLLIASSCKIWKIQNNCHTSWKPPHWPGALVCAHSIFRPKYPSLSSGCRHFLIKYKSQQEIITWYLLDTWK